MADQTGHREGSHGLPLRVCPRRGRDECVWWSVYYGHDQPGHAGQPTIVKGRPRLVRTYGEWTEHEAEWTEEIWRIVSLWQSSARRYVPRAWFLSLSQSSVRQIVSFPKSVAAAAAAGKDRLQVLSVPDLVDGDRLDLCGGRLLATVNVNGKSVEPTDSILAIDHDSGPCAVDITGELLGADVRLQVVTNVARALALVARNPVVETSGRSPANVTLDLRVSNQSHGQQLVKIEVGAVPGGWRANIAGNPTRLLEPGKGSRVHVEAGISHTEIATRRDSAPLAFVVRAIPIGDHRRPTETMVYVERPTSN